MYTSHALA